MLKAILVDDEEKSRTTLKSLLEMHCANVEVAELCESVDSAVTAIDHHAPALVFLDIEMPFQNGFALFEKITKPDFDVIFTTAYDQYAIKAIRYSAMDYLLKPIDPEELIAAVKRIREHRSTPAAPIQNLDTLLSNLKMKGRNAKIAVPTFEGFQMVSASDIIKCTADESYTHITLINNTRITVSRLLKEYEELLSDLNFLRVHNSCLVNLAHIAKYIRGDGGYAVMTDGSSVEVSRRKKNELLARLSRLPV